MTTMQVRWYATIEHIGLTHMCVELRIAMHMCVMGARIEQKGDEYGRTETHDLERAERLH